MTVGMACALLIGPAGALVTGWGIYRLWRGDGRLYPALQWLIVVPAMLGALAFAVG
jgi:hypothetical protein